MIEQAIIDKYFRIGENVRLVNERQVQHADGDYYVIRDGIIVVRKNAVVSPGIVL